MELFVFNSGFHGSPTLAQLRNDRSTLIACHSASPYLASIVDRHLYHKVIFHPKNSESESERCLSSYVAPSPAQFHALIASHTHIATYARSLRVVLTSDDSTEFTPRPVKTLDDEEIASLLPLLTHLSRVELYANMSWTELSGLFQEAFTLVLKSECIRVVCVEEIGEFPLELLCGSQKLTALKFSRYLIPAEVNPSGFRHLLSEKWATITSLSLPLGY